MSVAADLPQRRCVKCAYYHEPRYEYLALGRFVLAPHALASDTRFEGECLVLTCRRCGYQWSEQCKDTVP